MLHHYKVDATARLNYHILYSQANINYILWSFVKYLVFSICYFVDIVNQFCFVYPNQDL